MASTLPALFDAASAEGSGEAARVRRLAGGADWTLSDYVCLAGPEAKPFEERHEGFQLAAVLRGSFSYSTQAGRSLLHPGAMLLGNHGACFQCGHDHSSGDRCIALTLAPDLFAEVSATATGSGRYRFPAASLPASRLLTPVIAGFEAIAPGPSPLASESAVIRLTEELLAAMSGYLAPEQAVSARDERRIAKVLRYLDAKAAEPLDLERLASVAAMSKYHFLRVFRRVVGLSPYRYLLTLRMRQAALRLTTTQDTVAATAFAAGFGDLSTFNASFREVFGMSPLAYRRRNHA